MIPILTVRQGNYCNESILIRFKNKYPYDLTGKTIKFTVKSNQDNLKNDSKALITKEISAFDVPLSGKFNLVLTEDDTLNVKPGNYKFDIMIKDTDTGNYDNTPTGIFILENTVTKGL